MQLFLTGVLPFLAHNHPSAAAFLTCRHHNFHASVIPEFLSDDERVKSFCEARQHNQLEVDKQKQYSNIYNLFVQTPLMQFSPSLMLIDEDCVESILNPLLETKYFTRSLQRCSFCPKVEITNDLLQGLSKVQSLTKLELDWCEVKNKHFEIIINSFLSLESLTIRNAHWLQILNLSSQPATTKTLRSLTMHRVDSSFVTQFVPNFPNLRKLELGGQHSYQKLDLLPLSSSLPLLKDMSLRGCSLRNEQKSLKNLVHLSSLRFERCELSDDLSFLTTQDDENTVVLPELTTFRIDCCGELSTDSFELLANTPNLRVLEIISESFDNDCLQYLDHVTHLRKLDLRSTRIVGAGRSLQTLMQNLIQLEELNLCGCYGIGNHQVGAIAGALYSNKHTRLCVLNLSSCSLVDDDLNGIGALKNTLQELDLTGNTNLTNESLVHCKDLMKLKKLSVQHCHGIDDLSPLKDCLNLEDLNVSSCRQMTDDSFKVFSEEPNSFPKLRVLNLSNFERFTEKVFDHLSNNNNLVYQLKELGAGGLSEIFSSSATARNNIYKLKGLRRLKGIVYLMSSESDRNKLAGEVMRNLINLEEIY